MKRFGLIGSNISHSGSPELFRRAYEGQWPYDLLEGADFKALWKKFLSSYEGVNITAPFKEKAFAQVAALTADGFGRLTGPAVKAGAINLAVKQAGLRGEQDYILGDNTDFSAVVLAVAEACFPGIITEFLDTYRESFHKKVHQFFRQQNGNVYPGQPSALVIGCGGAGRAATVAVAELGFNVMLSNRTTERAASFALDIPEYNVAVCPRDLIRQAIRECDVLVYAASGALEELAGCSPEDFAPKEGHPAKIIIEANYKNPTFSGPLLEKALCGGASLTSGRTWLLLQALAGFPTLTGVVNTKNILNFES